jgi:hypothetical protein
MEKPLLLLHLLRSTDILAAIDAASAIGKRVAVKIGGNILWIILRESLS